MAVFRSLLCGVAVAAAASALPVPRMVGGYNDYLVETVLGVKDGVFYALSGLQPTGKDLLLTVETLGDWSGNISFRTTHTEVWRAPGLQQGVLGFLEGTDFLHPISDDLYAIDVRNETAGKMVTTGDEAYGSRCFFTANGTTYGANVRANLTANSTREWVRLFDVRKPNVTVGTFDLPGGMIDNSFGFPRCSGELGLMLVSPWMVDVSDVTAPKVLRLLPMLEKPKEYIDDFALDEKRRVLFTVSDMTLRTWSIGDPANPVLMGEYEVPFANSTVVPPPSHAPRPALGGRLHGGVFLHLLDNKLYMGYSGGATVLDVSSPEFPFNVATLDLRSNGCTSFHCCAPVPATRGDRSPQEGRGGHAAHAEGTGSCREERL